MTKHPSHGTVLSWDTAGGVAYSPIAQVKDISGPSITRGDIDTTTHDSTWRDFLPGVTDGGTVTFTLEFDQSDSEHMQTTGLLSDFDNNGCTMPTWELSPPDCGAPTYSFDITFAAYVNSFTLNTPVEGSITADLQLKITGEVTFTRTGGA